MLSACRSFWKILRDVPDSRGKVRAGCWLLLWLSALLLPSSLQAASPEVLILESGDRLPGESVSIEAGYLRWRLRNGQELMVPLGWISAVNSLSDGEEEAAVQPEPSRTETSLKSIVPAIASPTVVTASAEAVPLPPADVVPPPAPPIEASDLLKSDAEETPWTATIPFTETLQQGYHAAAEGYTAVNELASTWTRRINLGGQFIDGNAQTELFTLQVDLENSRPKNTRQLDVNGQWGKNNGVRSVNKWSANANYDWQLDEDKWIVFITSKNEYDSPANLDYRGTFSTGVGYRFYNDGNKRLITRIGPGYTLEIFRDPHDQRQTPDLYGELELRWPLQKRASFEHKVRINPSILDWELVRINSTSGLLVDLDEKDRWKLRLGLNYTYISQPSVGRLPADYVSTVSLMYTRK